MMKLMQILKKNSKIIKTNTTMRSRIKINNLKKNKTIKIRSKIKRIKGIMKIKRIKVRMMKNKTMMMV